MTEHRKHASGDKASPSSKFEEQKVPVVQTFLTTRYPTKIPRPICPG